MNTCIENGLGSIRCQGRLELLGRNRQGIFLGRKVGENNQTPKGGRTMKKRLALLCCILLLPTIAAAAYQPGQTNYGEWWAGVHAGALFASGSDTAATAGGIVGYNFCMANRPIWERYFGVAMDFTWNQSNAKTWGMETSSLYPSWGGYSTHSWEMTRLPGAGSCRS